MTKTNMLRKYKIKDLRGELKEYEEEFLDYLIYNKKNIIIMTKKNMLRKYKIKDLRGELKEYEEEFFDYIIYLKRGDRNGLLKSFDAEIQKIFFYLLLKHNLTL